MKIVVVASEAVPFAKTGGLADVAGALPAALRRQGHDASLFLPNYRRAQAAGLATRDHGIGLKIPVGDRVVDGGVRSCVMPGSGVTAYLIDQPEYFDRDGLYQENGHDYPDNAERFGFFGQAVVEAIRRLDLRPDVVQCNDWQTGMIPVSLRGPAAPGTLLTIHNLAYQGAFAKWPEGVTGLGRSREGQFLDGKGHLNFMMAGLTCADLISTVSPTYAREIQTSAGGFGLDGLLRERGEDLRGIVNGIDATDWNPATDPWLAVRYDRQIVARGKAACKADLQRRAELPVRADVPVVVQVGRLVAEKGWDLTVEAAEVLLQGDVQLVTLGEGQPKYHQRLADLASRHPGKVRAFLGFSDPLAHQVTAGADLLVMPSLFEPCGLNQLYGLEYGTVPVVHATGGLADTVVDASPGTLADGSATGFTFQDPTAAALLESLERALRLWSKPDRWARLIQSGMAADWSWDRGARSYVELLQEIGRRRAARVAG